MGQTPTVATTWALALSKSEWADAEQNIHDPSWGKAASDDGKVKIHGLSRQKTSVGPPAPPPQPMAGQKVQLSLQLLPVKFHLFLHSVVCSNSQGMHLHFCWNCLLVHHSNCQVTCPILCFTF